MVRLFGQTWYCFCREGLSWLSDSSSPQLTDHTRLKDRVQQGLQVFKQLIQKGNFSFDLNEEYRLHVAKHIKSPSPQGMRNLGQSCTKEIVTDAGSEFSRSYDLKGICSSSV
ncbi:hypothetical protein JMJ77_0014963 [Colletotrichum scovillei]|uniref:Uncharacterized protein n=1 Tax=Colletotrichum scovillei TaxID=1209932 RepID=A0A9P7QZM5_9PEZI|nr:hypothetical protein JMJ77_0014963 [Colletotrichum scovillei]KAG7056614.1 hypothetical protein JMJ78_0000409 [Colletotrichum scovillei]KAG7066506.1 hypothetical protein JMJ76_0000365 [Colletotrichum scovillei]